jgi:hypothetical protein
MTTRDETSRAAALPGNEPACTPLTSPAGRSAAGPRRVRRPGGILLATLLAALGCTAVVGGMPGAAAATMRPTAAMVVTTTPAPTAGRTSAPCRSTTGGSCGQQHRTVVLTDRNGGQTITVSSGTEITVSLSGRSGVWAEPRSSNGAVLRQLSGRREKDGGASGTFQAEAGGGSANITSTVAPHCSGICPMAIRLWVVHIVVRG